MDLSVQPRLYCLEHHWHQENLRRLGTHHRQVVPEALGLLLPLWLQEGRLRLTVLPCQDRQYFPCHLGHHLLQQGL